MKNYQSLVVILFVLSVFQLKVLAQIQNLEIVFEGNQTVASDILLAELDKCPYDFRRKNDDRSIKNTISTCLRGTVYEYYGKRGVFMNKIQADVAIEDRNGGKRAVVKIEETAPAFFGKLEIENETLELLSKENILAMFPVKSGELTDFVALRDFHQKVRDLYYDAGYLGFDTDSETEIYFDSETGQKTVDFRLRLDEGKPFTVKAVRFVRGEYPGILKNAALTDDLLQKTFGLKEGDIYSESRLQEALKRLNNLGGFGEVSNSRKYDKYGLGSSSSVNMDFRENYVENTVEIIIKINEPFIK